MSAISAAVLGELGRLPMYARAQLTAVRYWLRILEPTTPTLVRDAYLLSKSLAERGFNSLKHS